MIKPIIFTILFVFTSALAVVMFAITNLTFIQFVFVYVGLGVVLSVLGALAWKGKRYTIWGL